ncbi:hypothetical protein L249_6568 [Ophiocordyceps polyrhachis-furcata BCC 54312]|uniref:DNA-directed RNA polymerase II subunit RPB9 n=1 Tax=Ophiocordyceps polyrhachis-furcata BCC 54312 TaxID=1330021 RepID=A0A367LL55_9HYPO|nr:hypothetical protein L249_6568 [Ophiocordyceps polyrhachis-furcata BCC 54312]
MATPQSTASQDDNAGAKHEQITFRFCSECSNMLYPKEDKDAHNLQFTCRTCQYTEEASSSCVFRNVLNNSAGETAGVTQDVGSDPTVSELLPMFCLTCGVVLVCGQCSQPAAYMSVVKREDKRDEEPGFAHYVLAGSAPLYVDDDDDEYLEGDDMHAELPRSNKTCPRCNHQEAVFFQSQERSAETGMKLFYVCCECGHIFD